MEAVNMRVLIDRDWLPLTGVNIRTVMVEMSPQRGLKRLPLNLNLCIDASGSMESGGKLEKAKETAIRVARDFSENDFLSVTAFGEKGIVIFPASKLSREGREKAIEAINRMNVMGTTMMDLGLMVSYDEIMKVSNRSLVNCVILISDGYPTDKYGNLVEDARGYMKYTGILKENYLPSEIRLTAVGLGDPAYYDIGFLEKLGDICNGRLIFSESPEELSKKLESEFTVLKDMVIPSMALEGEKFFGHVQSFIRVSPEITVFDPPAAVDGSFSVKLGGLEGSMYQVYLLKLKLPEKPEITDRRDALLKLRLKYDSRETEKLVLVDYISHPSGQNRPVEAEVKKWIQELQIYLAGEETEKAIKAGDMNRTKMLIDSTKKVTKAINKPVKTKILEEMEEKISRGLSLTPSDFARARVTMKVTRRF